MDDNYFKRITTTVIFLALAVLSFFMMRPILLAIIFGVILAILFNPVYDWLYKITKIKFLSAGVICIFLLLLIFLPIWFLAPVLVDESIKVYKASLQMDFITPIRQIFPSLFPTEEFASQAGSILHSFIITGTNSLMNSFSDIVLTIPKIFFQLLIVFFTLFFVLRDKETILVYVQSILPFSKEVERELFKSSRDITRSVFYGQFFIGSIQGIILGIGLFIFRVPNAILLSLFAILAGIFPIVGPSLISVPVVIYLLIAGNTLAAIGVGIFGILASFSDPILRPIFFSKVAKMHPGLAVIGMIGGFLLFGVLGFIIGPLIIAYSMILLEIYRDKKGPSILQQQG